MKSINKYIIINLEIIKLYLNFDKIIIDKSNNNKISKNILLFSTFLS